MSEKIKLIQKQIEYYLSDKNLQHDPYFFEKLKLESFVPVESILSCNNIKKLEATKEDVVKALENSDLLEMTNENKGIKRKSNELPNFLGKKKGIEADTLKEYKKLENMNLDEKVNYLMEVIDPIIIYISSDKDQAVKWRDVLRKVTESYTNLECVYIRFSHQKGHAAMFPKLSSEMFKNKEINKEEKNLEKLVEETSKYLEEVKLKASELREKILKELTPKKFEIDGINFESKLADEDQLNDFWFNHGSHLDFCLSTKNSKNDKKRNPKGPMVNKNILNCMVKLGDEE